MNYRLGLFGFLAHPALDNEGHPFGNLRHPGHPGGYCGGRAQFIEAFGGDPSRVALGGQSAGAENTGANVLSPFAKVCLTGRFCRAVNLQLVSSAVSRIDRWHQLRGRCRLPGQDAAAGACLRSLSAARIVQLQGTANASAPFVANVMVDGTIVPIAPETAFASGQFQQDADHGREHAARADFLKRHHGIFLRAAPGPMTAAQYVANITSSTRQRQPPRCWPIPSFGLRITAVGL